MNLEEKDELKQLKLCESHNLEAHPVNLRVHGSMLYIAITKTIMNTARQPTNFPLSHWCLALKLQHYAPITLADLDPAW